MSWEMHEAAKRIANGWYAELEDTRKRNAVLGLENARLRELVRDMCKAIVFPYAVVNPAVLTERARELGVEVESI